MTSSAGGPADEMAFRASAAVETRRACDLATTWSKRPRGSELLMAVVAAELWRRLLPDTPCFEMIDEDMDRGFGHLDRRELEDAVSIWTRMVSDLADAVPADVTTLEAADGYLEGVELLTNWIDEISTDLHNAVLDAPQLRAPVLGLYESIALHFPEERRAMTLAKADIADVSGAVDEAIALYERLLALDPYDIDAAVGLASALAGTERQPGPDPRRALELLLSFRDHTMAAEYDLDAHIQYLRHRH